MSFDYRKLKGRIVEKFGSQTAFASAMGISAKTMSDKLTNKVFFSQGEINIAMRLLGIKASELNAYFFKENVQKL